jgi:hypothetical protein
MSLRSEGLAPSLATYYVDEAGDGVLFGPRGRNRLQDPDAPLFFMLGMVRCARDAEAAQALVQLRQELLVHPLYASIASLQPEEGKTARAFHAKDDHAEIRAKVFERLLELDFKFYAAVKDMRAVLEYVKRRNRSDPAYRYHPNELYDLTVRMLFKDQLHKSDHYRITFARRGKSDRTEALRTQLERTRRRFLDEHRREHDSTLDIRPAYPWEEPCLQIADYCLWALQRCYQRHEARFLHALWPRIGMVHDADDPAGRQYGSYLTQRTGPPDVGRIKNRWI